MDIDYISIEICYKNLCDSCDLTYTCSICVYINMKID